MGAGFCSVLVFDILAVCKLSGARLEEEGGSIGDMEGVGVEVSFCDVPLQH